MEEHKEIIRAFNFGGKLTIWKFTGDSEDGLPVGEVQREVEHTGEYQQCYFCKQLFPVEDLEKAGHLYYCKGCLT